jgi:hypothetical protein
LFIVTFVPIAAILMILLSLLNRPIETTERLRWRWKLGLSLKVAGVIYALNIITALFLIISEPNVGHAFLNPLELLVLMLIGLGWGGMAGVIFGFERGARVSQRLVAGDGIFKSLRRGLLFGAIGAGLGLLAFFSGIAWLGVFSSTVLGLAGAAIGGLDVPFKHYFLRLFLARGEKIPFRLPGFLNSCVEQLLLRRVGGGYIFIHRYLLEYFAKARKV